MYLGEVMSEHGRWELQLKGAGLTPFSRAADGRKVRTFCVETQASAPRAARARPPRLPRSRPCATLHPPLSPAAQVLRSSIREFLASEAMAALGVPTTRAAACVTSSSTVPRDVLYNGNAREEQCAVVSRVSRTFLRFGSFEICRPRDAQTGRAGPSAGAADARALVSELIDFVCELDGEQGGDLARAGASGSTERARALLECTAGRTAALLARWQAVGFTHGVLNTDNMAVLGETIDYGPFGFMGHFCKDYTPNSSDNGHRYSYEAQPRAAEWNVAKFAETLRLARVIDAADADMVAQGFWPAYERELLHAFRAKLALTSRGADDADRALLDQLLHALDESGADMCAAFLALGALPRAVHAASSADVELGGVLGRLEQASTSLRAAAKLARPAMPPAALRQIIALSTTDPARLAMFGIDDEVVRAAKQQLAKLDAIAALGSDVQKRARDRDAWEAWLRAYAARLHTEADGDTADGASLAEREARMAASNPAFVLREHLLQAAIARAECGDFAHVRQLLDRAQTPFLPGPIDEAGWSALVAELPTEDALDIVLS